jgi:hypothetical protein
MKLKMTRQDNTAKTTANSTFAIGGVSLRGQFSGKNPAHRKSENR